MTDGGSKSFLIISDIHACDDDPSSPATPSYVSSIGGASNGHKDPFDEIEKTIDAEGLVPDFILCPGDITDKSNPNSFAYAWKRLEGLASKFGSKLIATVGNHDIDSRYTNNKFDPRGFAMALAPPIPIQERERFLEFWSENFTLVHDSSCNILVVNTAAFHGVGEDVKAELEHGRISEYTSILIEERLNEAPEASVNIVLCHHHAVKAAQGDSELEGHTRGADRLVQILDENTKPWLIVHGHIHCSDIYNAHGGSNAPTVLSCASFSAQVNADAQNKHPNQVHLLTVEPDSAAVLNLQNAGVVKSWTWLPGVGWSGSSGSPGLGHLVGFGYRAPIGPLCSAIDQIFQRSGGGYVRWDEALVAVPELRYLLPMDFLKLEKELKDQGIKFLRDSDGALAQVTKS